MKRTWTCWAVLFALAAIPLVASRPGRAASAAPPPPAGWQVYTDPVYHYALHYPSGWEARLSFENSGGEPYLIRRRVVFQDPQGPEVIIDVWQRDGGTSIEGWLRDVEGLAAPAKANVLVDGQDAILVAQPGSCGVPPAFSTYVPFQDRVFKIRYEQAGDKDGFVIYAGMLRSFSPAGADSAAGRTELPAFEALVPSTCDVSVCPSTCSGGCTFAPSSQGCCGYHAVPRWNCARACNGSQMGDFMGNCVWWGAYTRPDVGALAQGDARNWEISVRNTGQLPMDITPKVGDIVVHPGTSDNHVAYVVWVAPDRATYKMSDMGWCADCGPTFEETKLRTVDTDDVFIHCRGNPAIPTTDWAFTDCPFGWTPGKGFSASSLDGTAWTLNPGQDPALLSPVLSLPAGNYNSIELTMANSAADTRGKIYFTTAASPAFDESKAVAFTSLNGGSWRTRVVRMSANPQWQGTITRIRVDPVEAGNGDGSFDQIRIARIRFANFAPPDHRVSLPLVVRNPGAVAPNRPPYVPSDPTPPDGASGVLPALTLTWTGGDPDGDEVRYDVYLDAGDSLSGTLACEDTATPACDPGLLLDETRYTWQVIATDEHSATVEGPVWAFTTTVSGCVEAIANGGFEADGDWEIPIAGRAVFTTTKAHTGSRSLWVGPTGPAPTAATYYSARQGLTIPAGAASATIRLWLFRVTEELPARSLPYFGAAALAGDLQYVLILNQSGNEIGAVLPRHRANDTAWTVHEADLLPYAGQTITLHLGVYNDGLSGATGMYVDGVSLRVCAGP